MLPRKGFKILEHTADEYIMAYGSSMEEAFESAAFAMFEVMTDTRTVNPRERELIAIEADDEASLLYSWLESLLLKFDVEGKLYTKFNVRKIKIKKNALSLEATIWGETYDTSRHPSRTDIKAVTYYQMEILKEKDMVILKFVLDI